MQDFLEKIAKLKAADQVTFKLRDAREKQKTIKQLGQLLSEIGIVKVRLESLIVKQNQSR